MISLREPVANSIAGTVTWTNNEIKARPAYIQIGKTQDRKTFKFTLPAGSVIREGAVLHVLLEEQGFKEEWDIPVAEAR
jgi:hypothetical protein